jgi:phosphate starvation-inducible PhoH-like protein
MMKASQVEKICLCRPVVGVGKDIGYLPGTKEEKVGPYLTPLFDELSYYIENSLLKTWADQGKLEIVPLSMMRGRTFTDCFVILDEAQNATLMELRMLLTRIGPNSKMVISGDLMQSDLVPDQRGAFNSVVGRLTGIDGIGIVGLKDCDIVRHRLIAQIEGRLAHFTESNNSDR